VLCRLFDAATAEGSTAYVEWPAVAARRAARAGSWPGDCGLRPPEV